MVVHLFATIAELKHRLKLPRSDLDFVRIVNLLSTRDWTFTFTFDHERLTLLAVTNGVTDASILIKGAVASVLDGQEISLQSGGRRWRSNDPLNSAALDSNVLTLTGPEDAVGDVVQ